MEYKQIQKADRLAYLPLLLIGDEDPAMLGRYLHKGVLFAALEDQQPVGVAMITRVDAQTLELKNIAVARDRRHEGIASGLLRYVTIQFAQQYTWLLVGTGDVDFENLKFYMRRGFRIDHIRKHFFDDYAHPIYADGLKLQDMIVMRRHMTLLTPDQSTEVS